MATVPLSSPELTAVNTKANSVLPSPQMQRSGRNQVAFSLPHSEPAVPQSPVSQSQGRQLAMPSTLGTGRYPETVQFHHIMEHYIKLNNAEIARNTIDLAAVVPVATPVLATVSVPSTSQSVAVVPLVLPTILDSVIGSRSALPDFIVGGYKVYSDKSGDLKDNEVFKSYKYKSDFARTLASKVNIFVDNTSGHGQSYEDWRLIFANAVGNEHYVDDFVMGDWLRGLLDQEVANDVDMFMGVDELGTSIYRHCSAKDLDTYLLSSIYASQLTDHHFNTEMQRVQGSHENPQAYVRDQVKKAYKIANTKQASQQYLCSQIYEGLLPVWKKALFYTFQGPIEKVYNDLAILSKDVCHFYKLHVQSGGKLQLSTPQLPQTQVPFSTQRATRQTTFRQDLPIVQHQVQQQVTRPFNQPRQTADLNPPFDANAFTAPVGSTMSMTQFNNLPRSVCKGGGEFKRGRGRNFVCVLCLTVGHTFEYCSVHNGFVEGGPPITTDPRNRSSVRTLAITAQ